MILLYIALAAVTAAVIAYFVVRDNKCKKNPLANIKFKDISLGDLEEKGKTLAQSNAIALKDGGSGKLMRYLKNIYRSIAKNFGFFDDVSKKNSNFSKEIKYILEKIYVIEEAYYYIKRKLSKTDYVGLPSFNGGEPRIFCVAEEFVSDIDGNINECRLIVFFKSFRENFTIEELELLPCALMIALLERFSVIMDLLIYIESGKKNIDKAKEAYMQSCIFNEKLKDTILESSAVNIIKSFEFVYEYDWEDFLKEYSKDEILMKDFSGIHMKMNSEDKNDYKNMKINVIATTILVVFLEVFITYISKDRIGNKGVMISAMMIILSIIPLSKIVFTSIQWIEDKFKEKSLDINLESRAGSYSKSHDKENYHLNYYNKSMDTYKDTWSNMNSIVSLKKHNSIYEVLNIARKDGMRISAMMLIWGTVIFKPFMFSLWITVGFLSVLIDGILALSDGIAEFSFYRKKQVIYKSLLNLLFLPMESYIRIDAMIKYILAKDKSKISEPYWFSLKNNNNEGKLIFKFMVPSLIISVVIGVLAFWVQSAIFYFMFPVIALWIISPFIAYGFR